MAGAEPEAGGPPATAPTWRGLLPRRATWYAILHHVLLALTIASVTVFAEKLPWFLPFDLIVRGSMSFFQALADEGTRANMIQQGYQVTWDPVAAGDRPRVIVVRRFPDQADEVGMHPTEFAAALIQAVVRQQPAVLAIDLDVDPVFDDPRLNDPECDDLIVAIARGDARRPALAHCDASRDHLLPGGRTLRAALDGRISLMRTLQEAAQTTAIVVTAPPLPLDARDLNPKVLADPVRMRMLSRQVLWTRDVCRVPNVQVALRLPDPSSGLAFRRDTPMLGNMAWDAASRAERPRDDITLLRHASDTLDVCTQFQPAAGFQRVASFDDAVDLARMLEGVSRTPTFATVSTISSRYYRTMSHGIYVDVRARDPRRPVGDIIPSGLKGQVVFLGDDQYLTRVLSLDRRPLVDFHAAVYYSRLHGARSLKHVAAFALDVGLGTILGILFAGLWGWYARARTVMDRSVATSVLGMVIKAPAYFRARAVLFVNLILQAALAAGMFLVAYALLRVDVWINPLPLVLGMSIKGLLASRHHHAGSEPESWWEFYNQHPDVPLQILAIVVSLGLAWYFGH